MDRLMPTEIQPFLLMPGERLRVILGEFQDTTLELT